MDCGRAVTFRAWNGSGGGPVDLRPGAIDGSMDEPDDEESEEVVSW